MLLDKDFVMQGNVRNYLGKTQEVTAPKFWQSSKDSPPTELAYITEKEKGLLLDANLHNSLKNNQPNVGASGLLSFDGWGDADRGTSDASYGGGNVSGSGDNRDYSGGGNDNQTPSRPNPHTPSGSSVATPSKADLGIVDAEEEYLLPDKDHYQATQKAINTAIKEGRDDGTYQADWNDWTKEQQDTYQLEMNKLKGTEDVNYSFYKGNEGTTNLSFNEHWKDAVITDPILKVSPTLRFLVAAGRTLKENFTTDYGTWKYGGSGTSGSGKAVDQGGWMGRLFNSDGSVNENISEGEAQQLYKEAQNDLPYLVGGTAPQESMVNKYFANLNNTNLGINQNYLNTYNTAKTNIANTLNMTQNTSQYGYNNILNDTYARSMTSANPFFEELTSEGLI